MALTDYKIIIEKSKDGYGAYCPDVSGCVAVGDTPEEAREEFLEALELHFEGLKDDGLPIPKPSEVKQ